jgi:hypothetical protein
MLSNISPVEPAFGAGACLPAGVPTAAAAHPGVEAYWRPRVARTAVIGAGIKAAQVKALGQANVRNQYLQTTRFTAASKGGVGPHPARDPV